jgi:hypothetical protein
MSQQNTATELLGESNIVFTQAPVNSVITVSGNNGSTLFSIKPDGEFVPGPGLNENSINEFTKTFYKKMTIFGKSFSQTLQDKETRIRELENQVEQLKRENGSQD